MAATFETQRLISMSLGKIAQSRGQRGGINLHKNLLVATVLHKARTAYMMESYNYQQTLQRQRQQAEVAQSQCQPSCPQQPSSTPSPVAMEQEQVSAVSSRHAGQEAATQEFSPDSKLGQTDATRTDREECRAGETSSSVAPPVALSGTPAVDCESSPVTPIVPIDNMQTETGDKENSPPAVCDTVDSSCSSISSPPIDHMAAAAQLAQDSAPANVNKVSLTSASPTCSVLKRRRDNPSAATSLIATDIDSDHPVSKKARVLSTNAPCDPDSLIVTSQIVPHPVSPIRDPFSGQCVGSSCPTTSSSDDSDSDGECDQEVVSCLSHHPPSQSAVDSPQISNLVSIFNSGFSGLCAVSSSSSSSESNRDPSKACDNGSNPEYLKSSQFTPILSRQDSFTCSSQLGRLESVPSAIILSA